MHTGKDGIGDSSEIKKLREGYDLDEIDLFGHGLLEFEIGQGKLQPCYLKTSLTIVLFCSHAK